MATGITEVSDQKMDFLNLLVTELRHQNPLEPLDNQQMAAQLAQFTQLELTEDSNQNISAMNETMEKMNSSFQGAMLVAEFDYARSLLGKEVQFYKDGEDRLVSGRVEQIGVDPDTAEPLAFLREVNGSPDGTADVIHAVKLYEISAIRN
jgi:flagellar hook assembly protein FlgD